MMPRGAVLLFLLAAGSHTCSAQWGIHATPLSYEMIAPRGLWNFMGGLDHDISPRNSMALDVNVAIDLFGTEGEYREGDETSTTYATYYLDRKSIGVTYHSMYCFSDNVDPAFHMGPFLGYRKVTYENLLTTYATNGGPDTRLVTSSAALFPVGLRFGYRSALDGFAGGLTASFGVQLGDMDALDQPYLNKGDTPNKFFMAFSYVLGIGWD